MAISPPLDDLLKSPTLLPEESLIAVHLKGGRGGIIFGLDTRSHKLAPGHLVVPHSGAFSGYDVDAVVDAARTRASFLANELQWNRASGDDRRKPDPWSLPPWPWR
jgi:hypothetical protein